MWSIFIARICPLTSPGKLLDLSHYFKVIVHRPVPFLLFINTVIDSKLHGLTLPFLSPPSLPLSLYNLSLMLDPLVVRKSFKKERRHAEHTWRYNCQAFFPPLTLLFLPPAPDVWLSCMRLYLWLSLCQVTQLVRKYSDSVCLCSAVGPFEDVPVNIIPFVSHSPSLMSNHLHVFA